MFAVTGVYVRQIFVDELGASPDNNVRRVVPLDNFGEIHPDPNLTYAKDLVDIVRSNQNYDFGAALDGDGVRKTHFFSFIQMLLIRNDWKFGTGWQQRLPGKHNYLLTHSMLAR